MDETSPARLAMEDLPRRSVFSYSLGDFRADLTFIVRPRLALSVLPRREQHRVDWGTTWDAARVYFRVLASRNWGGINLRNWFLLVLMSTGLVVVSLAVGISAPDWTSTAYSAVTESVGLLGFYLLSALTARRVGMLMAGRYLETDVQ